MSSGEEWFLPAVLNGVVIGAINGAMFVTIVVVGGALFGLTAGTS